MIENPLINKERQMKVCQVCGALQSITDTDKRLTMHLEGKLHTGYAKIRKTYNELKKDVSEKTLKDNSGKRRYSRSRSMSPRSKRVNENFD